jgi:hypothetical protein
VHWPDGQSAQEGVQYWARNFLPPLKRLVTQHERVGQRQHQSEGPGLGAKRTMEHNRRLNTLVDPLRPH